MVAPSPCYWETSNSSHCVLGCILSKSQKRDKGTVLRLKPCQTTGRPAHGGCLVFTYHGSFLMVVLTPFRVLPNGRKSTGL